MRTHRLFLVLNFIVTFQDNDNFSYMEYADLKKYLTRKEMMSIYYNLKQGNKQIILSNPLISSVTGV